GRRRISSSRSAPGAPAGTSPRPVGRIAGERDRTVRSVPIYAVPGDRPLRRYAMSTTSRTDEPARVTYAGLAADDTGGDDRPPLVLLHGLTFDRRIWRPVLDRIRALDPARRIVAFDLPGHGESPARPPHDFTRVMAALGAAFDAAHIDEPVLVGHSMSGGLASLFGAHHAVTAIVNVDQPPEIAPFAQLLGTLQEQLRGPQFDEVWRVF